MIPYTGLASHNRQNLADIIPLKMPLSIHVEPTNICNFRCPTCPQTLKDYAKRVGYYQKMPMELYRRIIRDVKDLGRVRALKLFGYGEPLVHPMIDEMVRIGHEVADRVEFTTNASLLTAKVAQGLIDAQLDYLRVSIYSNKQKDNEAFTHSKIPVERIYDNLKRLRQLRGDGLKPFIYVKMFETTTEEAEFRERYRDIADEITLEILHNMGGVEKLGADFPERKPKKICPLQFYQLAIGANGDVTICCIDWSFASKLGNVRESSLKDIWNGPELRKIQQMLLEGRAGELKSCKACTWSWAHTDDIDNISEEKKAKFYG